MLTAYDYSTASLLDEAGVDMLLVGDSLGNVILGYDSTLPVTMEDMIHHGRAVCRGAKNAFVVIDMPFMSYQISPEEALKNAITAAFQKVNIGLTSADAEEYFDASVKAKFDANPLSEVMNQKYLAFFEEEAIEAYNDYRRLKAMGDNVINLDNPINSNRFPHRFSYGSEDVTTNANIREAYGDGMYVYTEKVWWAGGTR